MGSIDFLTKLDEAIRRVHMLYPDGKICSCGMATGNPILKQHAPSCVELRDLLEKVKDVIER